MNTNYRLEHSGNPPEEINIQLKNHIESLVGKDGKINALDKKVTEVIQKALKDLKNDLKNFDQNNPSEIQNRLYELTLVKTLIDLRQEQLPNLGFFKSLFSGLKSKVGSEAKAYNELLPHARLVEAAAKEHNRALLATPPKPQAAKPAPQEPPTQQSQAAPPKPIQKTVADIPSPNETGIKEDEHAIEPKSQQAKAAPHSVVSEETNESELVAELVDSGPLEQSTQDKVGLLKKAPQGKQSAPQPQASAAEAAPKEAPRSPSSVRASYSQPGQLSEENLDLSPTHLSRSNSDSSESDTSLSDEEDTSPESSQISQPGLEDSQPSTPRAEGETSFTAEREAVGTMPHEETLQEKTNLTSTPLESAKVEVSDTKVQKEARVLAKTLKEFLTNASNDIKTFDNYVKLFEGVKKFKAFSESPQLQQFIENFIKLREAAKLIHQTIEAHAPPENSTDPELLLKSATTMAHQLASTTFAPFVQAVSQITVQSEKIQKLVKHFEKLDAEDLTEGLDKPKHKELKDLLTAWNTGSFTQALGSAISQPQAKMLKYPLLFRELASSVQKNRGYHSNLSKSSTDTLDDDEKEIKRLCQGVNQNVRHTEIIDKDGKGVTPAQLQEVNVAQMNLFLTDTTAGKIRFTDGGILKKVAKGTTSGLLDAKASAEKFFAMIDPENPQQTRKLAFIANFDENLAKEMGSQMEKALKAKTPELTIRAASYEQAVNELKMEQFNQNMINDIEKELTNRPNYMTHEKLRLDQKQRLTLDVSSHVSSNEEKSTNKTAEALLGMFTTASTDMQIKIIKTVDATDPALKAAFNKILTDQTLKANVEAIRENEAAKRKARVSYLG
jgi:hypothetical protein